MRTSATLTGFSAIIMWSLLALLTDLSGHVPAFQLTAMTFAIGASIGAAANLSRGEALIPFVPPRAWIVGVGGLFGYHFLYFTALRNAPAVEASLIAYLWPLLIVLGSALMPGERLKWHHVAGALLGLLGTALIVAKGQGIGFDARFAFGYAAAGLCALTWSSYSLLSRRLAAIPTSAVTGFCAATAILSLACHMALEPTVWPSGAVQWLAIAGLGLLPVGAAFYAWDHGVKHGNIQIIGAASYCAPLLSTLILIFAGEAVASSRIVAACLLITGGAALASREILARRPSMLRQES